MSLEIIPYPDNYRDPARRDFRLPELEGPSHFRVKHFQICCLVCATHTQSHFSLMLISFMRYLRERYFQIMEIIRYVIGTPINISILFSMCSMCLCGSTILNKDFTSEREKRNPPRIITGTDNTVLYFINTDEGWNGCCRKARSIPLSCNKDWRRGNRWDSRSHPVRKLHWR